MAKRRDDIDQDDNEDFHDSHTDIYESIERKNNEKEITGCKPKVGIDFYKSAKKHKSDQVSQIEISEENHLRSTKQKSSFDKVERYNGAQDEIHIVTKRKDDTDHGSKETCHKSHPYIFETIEERKGAELHTLIVENESLEGTEQ